MNKRLKLNFLAASGCINALFMTMLFVCISGEGHAKTVRMVPASCMDTNMINLRARLDVASPVERRYYDLKVEQCRQDSIDVMKDEKRSRVIRGVGIACGIITIINCIILIALQ